jgi:uncharacterized protein YqhQ
MKNETDHIDALIKKALTEEEAKFYDELNEQNLFGKLEEVYRGKMGWLAVIMNILILLLFGFFVFCVIRFFESEGSVALIKWAAGGFLSIIALGMLKLYFWLQMDKNDIKRELKRIELQIAALSIKS